MNKSYDYKERESYWQNFWEEKGIYSFSKQQQGKVFSIDTPPPTMSGKMHLGHAFSYTHQDIIARFHRMKGERVLYPFGTDDNGLPTEKLVEKENNVNIFSMQRQDFIKLCQETIKKLRPAFIQDWKNLGMSCDFNLEYSTVSQDVQIISQRNFIDLYGEKRIYRKKAPTLWCPSCQTAIAQADLKDVEVQSFFNDIVFKLKDGGSITIATTRPELLSSCVAIFVNSEDKRYKNLVHKKVIVPIFGKEVEIIADTRVNKEKGTGAVMCCTFGDTTDIDWYFDYKLPLRISIAPNGTMTELAGVYKGLKIKEARKRIIEDLKKSGDLIAQMQITHTVNVHERCDTEVEIIETTQWFIKYLDLRKDFISTGRKIKWFPELMRKRYENWINGLRWDWCISRQRYFGIPFPLWYCKKCGQVILAEKSQLPVDPISSKPNRACHCGSTEFTPETSVLDTWATSSLTPRIVQNLVKDDPSAKKIFPMSLRPQAHDIINFWLFYTVVRSRLNKIKVPWKNVMISGFVLDSKGEKMSKSKGNVIAPQEISEKYSVDAMRLWAAQSSLGQDLLFSDKELSAAKKTVTKLWNASRLCLIHIENIDNNVLKKKNANLDPEDKWILSLLERTKTEYNNNLEKFEFKKAKDCIEDFFWKQFCDNYLEIIKRRLYEEVKSQESKDAAKYTLFMCLYSILQLYAPYIPFVTEEIYQEYFKKFKKKESLHLTQFETINKKNIDINIEKEFNEVILAISQIRKEKSKRNISIKQVVETMRIESVKPEILAKYRNLISEVTNVKKLI